MTTAARNKTIWKKKSLIPSIITHSPSSYLRMPAVNAAYHTALYDEIVGVK
jgi:hypothetical protein